jgi:putative CocE/NonD family hydrolase
LLALGACHTTVSSADRAPIYVNVTAPSAPASDNASPPTASNSRGAYIRSHYAKFEYQIPMRDGKRLFTAVYVPVDAGPHKRYPMLLVRTPYGIGPYGLDRYRDRLGPEEAYETESFIFVFQDVRGRHMSEGEFVNMRPMRAMDETRPSIDESTDTHDTITWLLAHVPHHNEKVGQWGISYPGFYAAAGAIDGHPALKAVSPQAPIADWFIGDDMHRHGAFNLQLAFSFFSAFGKPRPEPSPDLEWKAFEFGTPDAYQFYLDAGPLGTFDDKLLKGEVSFWKDIVAHPSYDAFWKSRNLLPSLRNIRAAMLVVGGWYDTEDLYGPLHVYQAIEAQNPRVKNALVMGPWRHGGWHRTAGDKLGDADFGFATSDAFRALELAFFRQHLKGGDDARLAEATIFETGANRWRTFSSWPPAQTRQASLYLREASNLSFDPPTAKEGLDEYISDPARPVPYTQEISQRWATDYMAEDQRFAARRPDVLVYASAPLEHDVTLAGPLEAELYVATTGTDADFVVKLIDVNPGKLPGFDDKAEELGVRNRGGQQTLVRGEPFRARFRDSYEQAKPLVPNERTKLKFAINDVCHTFQRGHRIMVQVQSSWFPFIDRNPQTFVPNIFEAKPEDFVKATQRVYRNAEAPSALRVRVLDEGA